MVHNLFALKNRLSQNGIFFCFSGPVSQELLEEIGATLRKKMRLDEASTSTVLGVFSLVVEQAQNIIHYSAEKHPEISEAEEELKSGIIAVGYEDGYYFVLCGNNVDIDKVERIRNQLTILRNMKRDELNKYYRSQRKKEPSAESKGAGLGFIDMARKADRPIEFNFTDIDDKYCFFSSKIFIKADLRK